MGLYGDNGKENGNYYTGLYSINPGGPGKGLGVGV